MRGVIGNTPLVDKKNKGTWLLALLRSATQLEQLDLCVRRRTISQQVSSICVKNALCGFLTLRWLGLHGISFVGNALNALLEAHKNTLEFVSLIEVALIHHSWTSALATLSEMPLLDELDLDCLYVELQEPTAPDGFDQYSHAGSHTATLYLSGRAQLQVSLRALLSDYRTVKPYPLLPGIVVDLRKANAARNDTIELDGTE